MASQSPRETESDQLDAAIECILRSQTAKKLVIAGPGTGKTSLFKRLLRQSKGPPDRRLVLTFINNLRADLERDLGGLALARTLHSYCLGALYDRPGLRGNLSETFECVPGLAGLIAVDWQIIHGTESPHFVREMRNLQEPNNLTFYLERGEYYDAVDFDDTVYRALQGATSGRATLETYDQVIVDEYQDFNRMEAGIIDVLSATSPMLIVGDDDQALYSQLRNSSSEHIRLLRDRGEYQLFELPFCLRCPEVIVGAVGDVIAVAREGNLLQGRIAKPYRYFAPAKAEDSARFPKILVVETSTQRGNANYIGRYIDQAISHIPPEEITEAAKSNFPPVLVIVAKPYRDQIIEYLKNAGRTVDARVEKEERISREAGLSRLKADPGSNVGWRILLATDEPPDWQSVTHQTADRSRSLAELVPEEFRRQALADAAAYEPPEKEVAPAEQTAPVPEAVPVRVTSFEGAKGLSANYVFIAGLHNGELPKNPQAPEDLEVCKFIVGLTRTRKSCILIHTRNFAGKWMSPSSLISWIAEEKLSRITVDRTYWSK